MTRYEGSRSVISRTCVLSLTISRSGADSLVKAVPDSPSSIKISQIINPNATSKIKSPSGRNFGIRHRTQEPGTFYEGIPLEPPSAIIQTSIELSIHLPLQHRHLTCLKSHPYDPWTRINRVIPS